MVLIMKDWQILLSIFVMAVTAGPATGFIFRSQPILFLQTSLPRSSHFPSRSQVLRASLLHELGQQLPFIVVAGDGTSVDLNALQDSLPSVSIDDAKALLDSFSDPDTRSNIVKSLPKLNLPAKVPLQLQDALKAAQEATPGALDSIKGFTREFQGTLEKIRQGGSLNLPSLSNIPSVDVESVPLGAEIKTELSALKSQVGEIVGSRLSGLGSAFTEKAGDVLIPYQPFLEQTKRQLGDKFSVVSQFAEQATQELSKDAETLSPALRALKTVGTPRNLFNAENIVILPFWASVIVAPSNTFVKTLVSSYLPVLVAALAYTWSAYLAFQDPAALEGFASISDLSALSKGLGTEAGTATAWAHFIAQDLFVGRWIFLDGIRNGVWTAHSLTLAFLFGPTGILSHLLTRSFVKIFRWDIADIMTTGSRAVAPSAADDMAKSMVKDAEKQSKSTLRAADRQAEKSLNKANSEARKIIIQARKQAEEALSSENKIIASAEAQAQRILAEAQSKADAIMRKTSPDSSQTASSAESSSTSRTSME